jgi:NADH-quinone oxidoreductase subunit J
VFLLFALASVAGLYFLLNAEFLAAVQLVVYAGGTLILIVFGVMLTAKSPFARFEPNRAEVVAALAMGALLLASLVVALLSAIGGGAFGNQPLSYEGNYPIDRLGQALLGDYLVPFELASVLLLVVMIGAAYLAKARRRPPEEKETSDDSTTSTEVA